MSKYFSITMRDSTHPFRPHFVEERPTTDDEWYKTNMFVFPNVVVYVFRLYSADSKLVFMWGSHYRHIMPDREVVRIDQSTFEEEYEFLIEESFFDVPDHIERDAFPITNIHYNYVMRDENNSFLAIKYCDKSKLEMVSTDPPYINFAMDVHVAAMRAMPPVAPKPPMQPITAQLISENSFSESFHSSLYCRTYFDEDEWDEIEEIRNGFAYINVGYAGWFHFISVRREDNKLCAITSSRDGGDYIEAVKIIRGDQPPSTTTVGLIPRDLMKYFDVLLGGVRSFRWSTAPTDVDIICLN